MSELKAHEIRLHLERKVMPLLGPDNRDLLKIWLQDSSIDWTGLPADVESALPRLPKKRAE